MKTAIFIDGANLHSTCKGLGFHVDFAKLLRVVGGDLPTRAIYYTATFDHLEVQTVRPLLDWLSYNGYVVRSKPVKEFTNLDGTRKTKGNLDIEIAVDVMEMLPHMERMVLFSGDGDFRYLVEAAQRRGVFVTAISTIETDPSMIADELRRQADQFIDLASMRHQIEIVQKPRTVGVANG
jgi:uncharacterized LabA/DUF88 family protein